MSLLVLCSRLGGNNHEAATAIGWRLGGTVMAVTEQPDVRLYDLVIFVIPNQGDEELPQAVEDFLVNLQVRRKRYYLVEIGNYFGLESYAGCKKTAIALLRRLDWEKVGDVSIDSVPELDRKALYDWIAEVLNGSDCVH